MVFVFLALNILLTQFITKTFRDFFILLSSDKVYQIFASYGSGKGSCTNIYKKLASQSGFINHSQVQIFPPLSRQFFLWWLSFCAHPSNSHYCVAYNEAAKEPYEIFMLYLTQQMRVSSTKYYILLQTAYYACRIGRLAESQYVCSGLFYNSHYCAYYLLTLSFIS